MKDKPRHCVFYDNQTMKAIADVGEKLNTMIKISKTSAWHPKRILSVIEEQTTNVCSHEKN